ncbi:hypothetical protein JYG24_05685 [Lentisphaerota bacterium]|nr:hypothetical protein JYG24_05685 [Lentisphaerota bacterium]
MMVILYFDIVTTISVRTVAHYKVKSYKIFFSEPLFEEEMVIGSTHGKMTIAKKRVEYNRM